MSEDIDYSQNGEQRLILKKIKHLTGPRTVVDIGAYDGQTNSNSRALIEMGWRGVLIEPSPFAFTRLLDLYYENPKVVLVNAAIGTETRLVPFFECNGDQYGTLSVEQAKLWATRGVKYRDYLVPQIAVSEFVSQTGCSADVLSIDCEGLSFEVLKACPVEAWAPHAIVVEHDNRMVEIASWASAHSFDVIGLTPENILLLRA